MLVAIDAVGIRMGGGANLLEEFLAWLPRVRPQWEWLVFLLPREHRAFDDPPRDPRIRIEHVPVGNSSVGRLWWLYHVLPERTRQAPAQVLFAFANVASPRCSVRQVVYVHQRLAFSEVLMGFGWPLRAYLSLLRRLIVRGALKSEAVIVQTGHMRRRLEATAPALSGRIHVVPGPVSTPKADAEVRVEERRLVEGAPWPRLAYPAYPLLHKNHSNLMRAMPMILERYPSAVLFLTLQSDGEQRIIQRVRGLARALNVHKQVSWLGTLGPSEVRHLLRQATVMVFPSLDESFGLPLAEAITEGCPIAAADLPYAREVAGRAAVYFDPLNPSSIASAVCELISREDLRNKLRREAAARKKLFEPRTVAEQIAEIIERAVSNGPTGGSLPPGGSAAMRAGESLRST